MIGLPFGRVLRTLSASSIPCSAMLANSGEITPPWRDHPALRRPGFSLLKPVLLKVSGLKPLSNQFPCWECSDGLEQEIMINVIECSFDVSIHHPPFPLVR